MEARRNHCDIVNAIRAENNGAKSKTYATIDVNGIACFGARPEIVARPTGIRMPAVIVLDIKIVSVLKICRQLTGNVAFTV